MLQPNELEEAFKEFSQNLTKWVPDGIIPVNLELLQELGLLTSTKLDQPASDNLHHHFHVIEADDKVTLFNEQFAVWIVPLANDGNPSTLTFIALIQANKPHLEIVFSSGGVYNLPRYILKILEHFLSEVIDTEATINSIDKKKP